MQKILKNKKMVFTREVKLLQFIICVQKTLAKILDFLFVVNYDFYYSQYVYLVV